MTLIRISDEEARALLTVHLTSNPLSFLYDAGIVYGYGQTKPSI